MTRTLFLLAALACAGALRTPLVAQEAQPRVVKESLDGKNELKPGEVFEGSRGEGDNERDNVTLIVENDFIGDLEIKLSVEGRCYITFEGLACHGDERQPLKVLGHRFAKGKLEMRVHIFQTCEYTLTVTPCAKAPEDIEPNNDPNEALPWEVGKIFHGLFSRPDRDRDCLRISVPKGPLHLIWRRIKEASEEAPLDGKLFIYGKGRQGKDSELYEYNLWRRNAEFHFFPVFDAGVITLTVQMNDSTVGDQYELLFEPFAAGITEEEKQAAHKALAAGEKWLEEHGPGSDRNESYPETKDALGLMALLGGAAGKSRKPWLEETYIKRITADLKVVKHVIWDGQVLYSTSERIYEHSIATLALAEAAADGFESAKEPCIKAARFLLASQLTENRDKAWAGPVKPSEESHGGWRYTPDARDMDISATGWCVIALVAVDAAGLKIPGLRDAVKWGLAAIKRCYAKDGFYYQPESGGTGNIRNAIGALCLLLFGEEGAALDTATENIDEHLPAGTQVDEGHDYPMYYWYYATRANYLRGGKAWETWRTAMLRQLLWRQNKEGAWETFNEEEGLDKRYGTAMGLMILRMCLNDVPKYLKHEAKGF